MSKEIEVQGNQKCSESKSRGSPPYDAAAVHQALPDAVDEAIVSHAFTIVEKIHDGVKRMYLSVAQAEKKG